MCCTLLYVKYISIIEMVHKIRNYFLTKAEIASCFPVSILSLFIIEPWLLAGFQLKQLISNSLPVRCGCVTEFWLIIYKGKVVTFLGNSLKGRGTLFFIYFLLLSLKRGRLMFGPQAAILDHEAVHWEWLKIASISGDQEWPDQPGTAYMQNLSKLERNALLSSFSHCYFCFCFVLVWFGFLHLTKT